MIFRAFWGEPCPEAHELEEGHLHHARGAVQPGQRRDRGHRRRLPRPRAPHRRAGRADEGRDGRPRRAGRRSAALLQVPWVDSDGARTFLDPTFADSTSAPRSRATALIAFGLVLGTVLGAGRHLHRLPGLGPAAGDERARPRALRVPAPALRQQVVLRRAHRPRRRAAVGVGGALRPADLRARDHQRRASSAARPGSCKAGSAAARALQNGFLRALRRPAACSASSRSPSTSCSSMHR